ncbi:hypothetical protein QBC33DRAFT_600594 [Phialemonium atrogriseum]|uniref:Uncharacterized protein n=1 Tax=Phialemonium atrogriseum TaxID=1093897 RepID=A0AAJ0C6J1_9PEZI|nr:uncharacterized protein QBC33DRAFT_600594 [Phialemonium atrogriseum]KAK1770417.1 hypothetical protein QBC33DRAFT_600594 [Phialemonium atrogriseum]
MADQDNMADRDSSRTGNQGNGRPLSTGAIVAIVLVGSAVMFAGLAYFCIWLSRRRAARQGQDFDLEDDTDTSTTGTRVHRRKLYKKSWPPSFTTREVSPFRPMSLPAVPPAFRQPSLIFYGNPQPGRKSGSRTRKASWIDEDVLHGPRVAQQTEPKRRSLRDSWPLKNRVPTLPKLNGSNQPHEKELQQREDLAMGPGLVQQMPPRRLPEPPGPVVTAGSRQPVDQGPTRSYYAPEDARGQRPNATPAGPRILSPQKARTRQDSTGSTLTEILKSTDKRLQTRALAGISKTAGTSRETLIARSEAATDGSTLCQSRSNSRTPSPTKSGPSRSVSAAHQRKLSESSVTSETDSLVFVQPSPTPGPPNGLTSPNKVTSARELERQRPQAQSPCSSVSSALSTLYSEDEGQEAARDTSTLNRDVLAGGRGATMPNPGSIGDPFFSPSSARPNTGHRGSQPLLQGVDKLSYQDPGSSMGGKTTRSSTSPMHTLRLVDSTTSNSVASARASHPYLSNTPVRQGRQQHRESVIMLPKPVTVVHRSIPSTERPSFIVTSPSAASMLSPAISDLTFLSSHIEEGSPNNRLVSPSRILRPQASSPTLGRNNSLFGHKQDIPPLPHMPVVFAARSATVAVAGPASSPSPSPLSTSPTRDSRPPRLPSRSSSRRNVGAGDSPTRRRSQAVAGGKEGVNNSNNNDNASTPSLAAAAAAARRRSSLLLQQKVQQLQLQHRGSVGSISGSSSSRRSAAALPGTQTRMQRSLSVDSARGIPTSTTTATITAATAVGEGEGGRGGGSSSIRDSSRDSSCSASSYDSGPFGLAATIAQLRRMNSTASGYSARTGSVYSTTTTAGGGAGIRGSVVGEGGGPMLKGGAVGAGVGAGSMRRGTGTWNYLSLDARVRKAGQGQGQVGRSAGAGEGRRGVGGRGETGGEGSSGRRRTQQLVRGYEGGRSQQWTGGGLREGSDGNNRGTPTRENSVLSFEKLAPVRFDRPPSQDSLGLYDKDGFLISTPVREKKTASPSRVYGMTV